MENAERRGKISIRMNLNIHMYLTKQVQTTFLIRFFFGVSSWVNKRFNLFSVA